MKEVEMKSEVDHYHDDIFGSIFSRWIKRIPCIKFFLMKRMWRRSMLRRENIKFWHQWLCLEKLLLARRDAITKNQCGQIQSGPPAWFDYTIISGPQPAVGFLWMPLILAVLIIELPNTLYYACVCKCVRTRICLCIRETFKYYLAIFRKVFPPPKKIKKNRFFCHLCIFLHI